MTRIFVARWVLGLLVIVAPFFYKSIEQGVFELLYIVLLGIGILVGVSKEIKRTISSIDLIVIVYIIYGIMNILFVRNTSVDNALLFQWVFTVIMNKGIILFLLAIFVACSEEDKLENALKKSKTNRKELEQVLEHYSKNKTDSLKLRAARFLIENMPGHYTYSGRYLELYKKELHFLNPDLPWSLESYFHSLPLTNPNITDILEKQYDIETIKSDFLIKHIDYKFKLWEILPWKNKISFKNFCEYLLPYRIEIEPIPDISQDSLNEHIGNLASIFSSIKNCEVQMFDFKEYVSGKIFKGNNKIHSIRLLFSDKEYVFDCIAIAYNLLEEYKTMGIPARIDFTPH